MLAKLFFLHHKIWHNIIDIVRCSARFLVSCGFGDNLKFL